MPCRQGGSCNAPAGFEKENVQAVCRDGYGYSAGRKVLLCLCRRKSTAAVGSPSHCIVSEKTRCGSFYSELGTEFPFIVTSCNYTGQPIVYKDEEAQRFFDAHKNIAALFTYEREILRPADDAVTRVVNGKVQILRRTKGYMPEPVAKADPEANVDVSHNNNHILALGAQMEPGFCLTAEGSFFPAEIPGDVSLEKTEQFFADSVQDWTELLYIRPQAVVSDLHPGYATAQWGKMFAEKNGLPFYQVQHHHAHALAVMAEHHLKGKVLAACFDGTGLGTDGTVWGGEFLLCEGSRFTRVGHLKTISMLGGDVSMQQAWKTALCHLAAAGLHSHDPRFAIVKKALQQNMNAIRTSSMGRLFDAAASLPGQTKINITAMIEGSTKLSMRMEKIIILLKKFSTILRPYGKRCYKQRENVKIFVQLLWGFIMLLSTW